MGLPIWLVVAQTVTQAVGAHQEAKAQEQAYKAQAAAAQQNAAIEAKKAEQIAEGYAQKQRSLTDRMRLVSGQARAAAGASGLTGDGSVADILNASYDEYEKDSLNLLSQQRNDTWGSYVNRVNYLNQAEAARASAANAKAEGRAKVFSTILGGAASIYGMSGSGQNTANTSQWYDYGSQNILNSGNAYANAGSYFDLTSGDFIGTKKLGSARKDSWTNFGALQMR